MKAKKVLVPVDFSALGDAALDYAAALAGEGGELYVAHVREGAGLYKLGHEEFFGGSENGRVKVRELLDAVCPADSRAKVYHRLLEGEPVDAILNCAQAEQVDLIMISTHGRSGLSKALLGSVATALAQRAHCPVMMLKMNC